MQVFANLGLPLAIDYFVPQYLDEKVRQGERCRRPGHRDRPRDVVDRRVRARGQLRTVRRALPGALDADRAVVPLGDDPDARDLQRLAHLLLQHQEAPVPGHHAGSRPSDRPLRRHSRALARRVRAARPHRRLRRRAVRRDHDRRGRLHLQGLGSALETRGVRLTGSARHVLGSARDDERRLRPDGSRRLLRAGLLPRLRRCRDLPRRLHARFGADDHLQLAVAGVQTADRRDETTSSWSSDGFGSWPAGSRGSRFPSRSSSRWVRVRTSPCSIRPSTPRPTLSSRYSPARSCSTSPSAVPTARCSRAWLLPDRLRQHAYALRGELPRVGSARSGSRHRRRGD